MNIPRVLLIEGCDYDECPLGGQLTYVKQVVRALGDSLAVVGLAESGGNVGVWRVRELLGHQLLFFGIASGFGEGGRPAIPRRLSVFMALRQYRKQILSLGVEAAYVHAPETMLAIQSWKLKRVCYHFHGTGNALSISRYPWARFIAATFERKLFQAIGGHAELALVSADEDSIRILLQRSCGLLRNVPLVRFPTRVDRRLFFPKDGGEGGKVGSVNKNPVFISCGRLSRAKGWELLLEAFNLLQKKLPTARLYLVGEGEDRHNIEARISELSLNEKVQLKGRQSPESVAELLRRADVFVMASFAEGWPVALLEALSTGLPIVSTRVSAAHELIVNGENGYVVDVRDPQLFGRFMIRALSLPMPNSVSVRLAQRYSVENLRNDLSKVWPAFDDGR